MRYGPHGGANLADIWRRSDLPRDGRAPVLLQVPGGAWAIGMRRPQGYPMMSDLAERGWVCVSMAYRVSPRNTWPDHIVDVKRALAWVKENIADYGGDPDFVAISGGSAGGHLAALAALTPNDPQYQPGFEDADTSVVAAVPVYGRYDWFTREGAGRPEFIAFLQRLVVKKPFDENRQDYLDASPITRLRADAPPFFVLHGTDDSIIPVDEAREFVAALREVSDEPVAYAEVPHAQHAFDFFGSPRGHYTAEAIERFLSWVHARSQRCADEAAGRLLRHSGGYDGELIGKSCSTPYFDEFVDHRGGDLVRVVDGGTVGDHRDAELVDVAPHGDVQATGRGHRADTVDLGDQRAADPAILARARHIRDVEVEHLVLAVAGRQPFEQ